LELLEDIISAIKLCTLVSLKMDIRTSKQEGEEYSRLICHMTILWNRIR